MYVKPFAHKSGFRQVVEYSLLISHRTTGENNNCSPALQTPPPSGCLRQGKWHLVTSANKIDILMEFIFSRPIYIPHLNDILSRRKFTVFLGIFLSAEALGFFNTTSSLIFHLRSDLMNNYCWKFCTVTVATVAWRYGWIAVML